MLTSTVAEHRANLGGLNAVTPSTRQGTSTQQPPATGYPIKPVGILPAITVGLLVPSAIDHDHIHGYVLFSTTEPSAIIASYSLLLNLFLTVDTVAVLATSLLIKPEVIGMEFPVPARC